MSVICAIRTKSAIVMAADSRETYRKGGHDDTFSKIYKFINHKCLALFCGSMQINGEPIKKFLRGFEANSLASDDNIILVAKKLANALDESKAESDTEFLLGGYFGEIARIFRISRNSSKCLANNFNVLGTKNTLLSRDLPELLVATMSLETSIKFADFFISYTIDCDKRKLKDDATCGGEVDIYAVKKDGINIIREKKIRR